MTDMTSGIEFSAAIALLDEAKAALMRSYSPYSNFKVGAALLTDSGGVFTGTNVENASYGLTICAERNAVAAMISNAGASKIVAVAVASEHDNPIAPCGACLQVIAEFAAENCVVIAEKEGQPSIVPFSGLFPSPFTL